MLYDQIGQSTKVIDYFAEYCVGATHTIFKSSRTDEFGLVGKKSRYLYGEAAPLYARQKINPNGWNSILSEPVDRYGLGISLESSHLNSVV